MESTKISPQHPLGFWSALKRPIFALAPMIDVTDSAFRQMFAHHGKPDVFFTEFVSTDGLCSPGRDNMMTSLQFAPSERPIVAQIFGAKPENFFKTAQFLRTLGFDGIDINMGCPEKKIVKQGSCAALIQDPKLAQEIIAATKEGAFDLPVSIKTRIGYHAIVVEEWIGNLVQAEPAVITIHGRTKKEMSKVPAHWDMIKRGVDVVRASGKNILVLGNGDIKSRQEGLQRIQESGVDGVMVGRGVFGNPWFFNTKLQKSDLSLPEIVSVMLEHTRLYEKLYKEKKPFALMKKHFASYLSGFPGAKDLRHKLMLANTSEEVKQTVDIFL